MDTRLLVKTYEWANAAALACLLVAGCSHRNMLEGSVTDRELGPVAGAEVVILNTGQRATSSSDGRFLFELEEKHGKLQVRIDGANAAAGPYSLAFLDVPRESWNLAPGGKHREGLLEGKGVIQSVAAILVRLDVEAALPVSSTAGGVVTSMNYPGARLEIPEGSLGASGPEQGIALTRIPNTLLPVPLPKGMPVLAAVHIYPATLNFNPASRLLLPSPLGVGFESTIKLFSLDMDAGSFKEVGPASLVEGAQPLLFAEGVSAGGYYIFVVQK